MPRVFILVNKRDQEYDSIPAQYHRVFLFPYIRDFGTMHNDIVAIKRKIDEVLGDASLEDKIIFNGPSWLIAIAGMVWLSNPDRQNYDIFRYDMKHKNYFELKGLIDSTEEADPEELNETNTPKTL